MRGPFLTAVARAAVIPLLRSVVRVASLLPFAFGRFLVGAQLAAGLRCLVHRLLPLALGLAFRALGLADLPDGRHGFPVGLGLFNRGFPRALA